MRARLVRAGLVAAGVLFIGALGRLAPASAAPSNAEYLPPPPPPPPPPPSPSSPAVAPTVEQVEALQQRLLGAQQTIATLDRQLAEAKNRAVAMDQCRVKNGRLVFIGRELIEGYARRYGESKGKDPLQLGRRRFEFELQALSDAVYDNRVDVPVPLPGEKRQPAAPAVTGKSSGSSTDATAPADSGAAKPSTKDK